MYFTLKWCKLLVNNDMKKLILVNGDLAAGKSHFAIILKNRFNLPLLTKDELKEQLAETNPYESYEESHKLSIIAMEMLFDFFKEHAKRGEDLILEANFRGPHFDELEKINKDYGYDILDIDLVGSVEILHKRYVNRFFFENRHAVHKANDLSEFEAFKKYTLSRRKERTIGEVLLINADDLSYQSDEKIFEKIAEFLNK